VRARGPERLALLAAGLLSVASAATAWSHEPERAPNEALVELGRRLFFDPAVSRSGTRSCADCHDPEHGFSDPRARSLDVSGLTPRHAQTLIDCGEARRFHWEGELTSIRQVVTRRMLELVDAYAVASCELPGDPPYLPETPPGCVGGCSLPPPGAERLSLPPPFAEPPSRAVAGPEPALLSVAAQRSLGRRSPTATLVAAGRHERLLRAAKQDPAVPDVAAALEAYVKTIRSTVSAYDRFAGGETAALSPAARRGLDLFRGTAGCSGCHRMEGRHAAFTDHDLHEFPLPSGPPRAGPPRFGGDLPLSCRPPLSPLPRFKTPTLRDVATRGPYLHDGSEETLEGAVRRFLPEDLSGAPEADAHVADLVAFLHALTSDARPGLPAGPCRWRAKTTRLRLVDAEGRPLVRLRFEVVSAGDPLSADRHPRSRALETDGHGFVAFDPFLWTHARILLADGVRPEGGPFVPDTCDSATLRLPLRGWTSVQVRFPGGGAPPALRATHVDAPLRWDGVLPRSTFVLERLTKDGESETATYRGPNRTDVGREARFELPAGFEPVSVTLGSREFVARAVATPVAALAAR
jgi:cytochrome c peroxidase